MFTWGGFSFIINLIKQTNMTIEEYKQLIAKDTLKIGLDVDETETEEKHRGGQLMKTLLEEIHDIIEEGDNGTPHDIVDIMFNLLDVNQLAQLQDTLINQNY